MTYRIIRFVNLALASMITGNGVGSLVFVFPAIHQLEPEAKAAAEQALTRTYLPIMRALMPATMGSCLVRLAQLRGQSAAFGWTLLGAAGFAAMLGITLVELPINRETLEIAPDAPPANWPERRERWERFNQLRTLCEVVGWSALVLGALNERDRD
jgi:hypothetical protein